MRISPELEAHAKAYREKYGYDLFSHPCVWIDRVRYATDSVYRLQCKLEKRLRDFAEKELL